MDLAIKLIVLLPLLAAAMAGLFCRVIGDKPAQIVTCAALLAEILFGLGVLGGTHQGTVSAFTKAGTQLMTVDNTRAIGQVLYTQYFYVFQVAGLVLLVAMIGAIVLTLRRRPGVRRQRVSDQLYRPKEESITLVKVPTRGGV